MGTHGTGTHGKGAHGMRTHDIDAHGMGTGRETPAGGDMIADLDQFPIC